jgi:hypothetical protein
MRTLGFAVRIKERPSKISVGLGTNIFAAHVVTSSVCVFCKRPAGEEEIVEHVGW